MIRRRLESKNTSFLSFFLHSHLLSKTHTPARSKLTPNTHAHTHTPSHLITAHARSPGTSATLTRPGRSHAHTQRLTQKTSSIRPRARGGRERDVRRAVRHLTTRARPSTLFATPPSCRAGRYQAHHNTPPNAALSQRWRVPTNGPSFSTALFSRRSLWARGRVLQRDTVRPGCPAAREPVFY